MMTAITYNQEEISFLLFDYFNDENKNYDENKKEFFGDLLFKALDRNNVNINIIKKILETSVELDLKNHMYILLNRYKDITNDKFLLGVIQNHLEIAQLLIDNGLIIDSEMINFAETKEMKELLTNAKFSNIKPIIN